ncbi:hypothetical protein CO230_06525 [Chryseobacterium sp. 6424]|uniref:hypothetical protein n=1 Tax=Chryseobacterium sp. 6424 TaxID=2039166 RepID=UPI000F0CF788|nr:hypothetical protein [Chryseobacterium sp. 6424]AYO57807.1 hypothetical protein CO230_06525 [Chryseobacterium sp. 6424]
MIDKNFYLENMTAFDMMIESDRPAAEKVIFKVYCILQRDKYWLSNVATPEEITEEDTELLAETEAELTELDEQYNFRFANFHQLVMNELKAGQEFSVPETLEPTFEMEDDLTENEAYGEPESVDYDEEDFNETEAIEDEEWEEEDDDIHNDEYELNQIISCILTSAKQSLSIAQLQQYFPEAGEEFLSHEVLMPIITANVGEKTHEELVELLAENFELHDMEVDPDTLYHFVETAEICLEKEMMAFDIATDSLNSGMSAGRVLATVKALL